MKLIKTIVRKYWAVFIIGLKEAIAYRAEVFLWVIIDAMPLASMLVLWLSAFSSQTEIAGYTQTSLIAYYIAGFIFIDLTGSYFAEDVLKEIKTGTIVNRLVIPLSPKRYLIANELSWRVMTFLSTVIPTIILVIIFTENIMPQVKIHHILFLPLFLSLTYIIQSIFNLMIISIGFIFEEARSLVHLQWMLGWLFSGSMMPFEFMPKWLSIAANILPFKFRYYVPIQIYFNNITGLEIVYQLALEIIWVIILYVAMQIIWNQTIKKFTAVGN